MDKNSKPNLNVKTAKREPFKIPRGFFHQLNEFSHGGYCLILVNSQGEPVVYSQYDNAIAALGVQKFALDYFETVDKIQSENFEAKMYERGQATDDGEALSV